MSTAHATLEVIVDHLEQHRQRVAEMVAGFVATERDKTITALYELERSLGQSVKVARRAISAVAERP